jgi:hypothetical protein
MILQRLKVFNQFSKDINAEDEKPVQLTMQNVTIKTGKVKSFLALKLF